jgi:hypothetical protein
MPGALSQGAMNMLAAGMTQKVNRRLRGGGPGLPVQGQYNAREMSRLWMAAGGDPTIAALMGAIGMAESTGNPRAVGPPTSGGRARGLWQIMWPLHAGTFPGLNPFNPNDNARMAVSIYRSQGLGAWEAYTRGMHMQYMATGGRVPKWGGWNRKGGRFSVDGPTIFGAGEDGKEDVTITPKGGPGPGAAGISVTIEHLEWKRDGDLKKAIKKELKEVADDLHLVGSKGDD